MNPFHIELNWFRGPTKHRYPRDGLLLVDYVSLVSSQASLGPWCRTWKLKTTLRCRNGGLTYYTLILQFLDLRAINSGTMSSKNLSRFSKHPIYRKNGGQKPEPMRTLK